ncbi:MAG: PAS-domain containing protein [Halopseudomonas aestusnigri]
MDIRILFIGDDLDTHQNFKIAIEARGYSVDAVGTGKDGLERCATNAFDVVAIDCTLSGQPVAELAQNIIAQENQLPVLMIAEKGKEQEALLPMQYGISNYVTKDPEGRYLQLLPALLRDLITRSSHAKLQTLEQTEFHFRTRLKLLEQTLGAINQGFVVWDEQKRLVLCNDIFWEVFDIPKGLMGPGTHLKEIIIYMAKEGHYGEGDPKALAQNRYQEILKEDPLVESQHISKTGRIFKVNRYPMNKLGRITTFTELTDILEKERTSQMLREAIETFTDSVILYDQNEEVVFTNARYHEVYRASPPRDKIVGCTFTDMLRSTIQAKQIDSPLSRTDPEAWIAMRLAEKRGNKETHGESLHSNGMSYRYKICRSTLGGHIHVQTNITEQKLTEKALRKSEELLKNQVEELKQSEARLEAQAEDLLRLTTNLTSARDELEKINDQKDKFFSIIAHDLKGPFTALLGYTSLLSRDGNTLDQEKIMKYSGAVHQSAEQVFKLLENLLEWSLIQMGRMECDLRPVDLNDVIKSNLKLFKNIANNKDITLCEHYQDQADDKLNDNWDNPIMILADFDMVDTVIRNLLNNAIKFTPDHGRVSVHVQHCDPWIEIEIKDTGIGISTDRISRLFQLDENISTPGTSGETGTGLGLHLCKDLIEKLSGEITVESQEGKGTTFRIHLPPYLKELAKPSSAYN